jgi:hypothetical protein
VKVWGDLARVLYECHNFTFFLQTRYKTVTLNLYNDLNDQRRIVLMKTIKLAHILFSLTMVAALALAAIPASPAYALSDSATQQSTSINAADNDSSALTAAGVVVCRTKIFWRHGYRVSIRVCHRVHPPSTK